MPQLLTALVEAGFDRLATVFADRPKFDDPVAGFCDLALAYRGVARANPHLFDLMFGLSNPGGYRADQWASTPEGAGGATRRSSYFDRAYEPLVRYARRAIAQGHLRDGEPEAIAAQLWSFSDGFVVLELAGHFAPFADPLREVLGPLATNLVVGLGDDPGHAAAVMRSALTQGGG
ncbi:TetR-like C-terminal domain-containing protein [Actinomycetospora sp. CA-101289]|uniref:TetR-like C-terminal domain-containing protein n=1 Tax=Actinomycetospora sp. CA-101289 TaxID=3239893 RepID=UPI003D97CAF8